MNCEKAMELLSAKLDGELDASEEALLAEHLAQCPECRALEQELLSLDAALRTAEEEPPAELAENVMASVRRERIRRTNTRRVLIWAAAAAVLALFLGVSSVTLPKTNTEIPNAVAMGSLFDDLFFTRADAQLAKELAEQTGAEVLTVKNCIGLSELETFSCTEPKKGVKLYELDAGLASQLQKKYRGAFEMELCTPEQHTDTDTVYVLIFK